MANIEDQIHNKNRPMPECSDARTSATAAVGTLATPKPSEANRSSRSPDASCESRWTTRACSGHRATSGFVKVSPADITPYVNEAVAGRHPCSRRSHLYRQGTWVPDEGSHHRLRTAQGKMIAQQGDWNALVCAVAASINAVASRRSSPASARRTRHGPTRHAPSHRSLSSTRKARSRRSRRPGTVASSTLTTQAPSGTTATPRRSTPTIMSSDARSKSTGSKG